MAPAPPSFIHPSQCVLASQRLQAAFPGHASPWCLAVGGSRLLSDPPKSQVELSSLGAATSWPLTDPLLSTTCPLPGSCGCCEDHSPGDVSAGGWVLLAVGLLAPAP